MRKLTRVLQLAILIVFTVVFSCKKDYLSDNTCNVSDPLEDLPWLKSTIENIKALQDGNKYYYISMAKYNGETVFLNNYCDPLSNYVIPVINCSGDLLGMLGEISEDSLTDRKVIWKSENSECFTK